MSVIASAAIAALKHFWEQTRDLAGRDLIGLPIALNRRNGTEGGSWRRHQSDPNPGRFRASDGAGRGPRLL